MCNACEYWLLIGILGHDCTSTYNIPYINKYYITPYDRLYLIY